MLIWKAELPVDTLDIRPINLPFSTTEEAIKHILKADIQYGEPVMWFQADTDESGKVKPKKEFVIQAIGTGHDYSDVRYRKIFRKDNYIGTCSLMDDTLILHYFLAIKKDYESLFEQQIEG